MKRAEEISFNEAKQQSKTITKKESRCLIFRLKVFAHVILRKKTNSSPMRSIIDLCNKVVGENDQFLMS